MSLFGDSLLRGRVHGISKSKLVPRYTYDTFRGIGTQELDNLKGNRKRVVILGSGWAGYNVSRQLDVKKFQPVVISPRSYFAFTPLLASTAVGTLEFRTTLEPVRRRGSKIEFFQGWADDVDFEKKRLFVEESAIERTEILASKSAQDPKLIGASGSKKGGVFEMGYDTLVVAVGCYSQTFGIPGVRENALFLKDIRDARKIRTRILDCFETAALPSTSDELRKNLLNFAIVGGGPTGVEFAAELHDLWKEDLQRLYPTLTPFVRITIFDVASKLLPMFDQSLAKYALDRFNREGVNVKTKHNIDSLSPGLPGIPPEDSHGCLTLKTKEAGDIGVGMVVWSTGLMMNPFIQKALSSVHAYPTASASPLTPISDPTSHTWELKRDPKSGGLVVDEHFKVKIVAPPQSASDKSSKPVEQLEATVNDVFALGDVSVFGPGRLPATAQVANQQAKWLAKHLNKGDVSTQSFTFRNLGIMTYIGNMNAIMQTGGDREIKGRTAWLLWRGAYMTQAISWRNKLMIPVYWAINWVFGRDISRF